MACCDLHLLPYDCAGWELTVLETGSCGVANVITEVANPPEYAREFSAPVPVGCYVIGEDIRGLIDIDLALRTVLDLLDNPPARHRLAANGPKVAARFDWQRVCRQWVELLERCGRDDTRFEASEDR